MGNPSRPAPALVASTLLIACATALSQGEALAELAPKLQALRVSTSDRLEQLSPVPLVHSLRGTSRAELRAAFGRPDNGGDTQRDDCAKLPQWRYVFFHLPRGWRGGGPEPILVFDESQRVSEAKWEYSR